MCNLEIHISFQRIFNCQSGTLTEAITSGQAVAAYKLEQLNTLYMCGKFMVKL